MPRINPRIASVVVRLEKKMPDKSCSLVKLACACRSCKPTGGVCQTPVCELDPGSGAQSALTRGEGSRGPCRAGGIGCRERIRQQESRVHE